MKIRSYTISGVNDIDLLPLMQRVQFTLNGHTRPERRRITDSLDKIENKNTDIYLHEDFVRTVPRYAMMVEDARGPMIEELATILDYSVTHPNIKGVIIHMDNPFTKDMLQKLEKVPYENEVIRQTCKRYIISPFFKPAEEIARLLITLRERNTEKSVPGRTWAQYLLHLWNKYAVDLFYSDLSKVLIEKGTDITKCCKIYIENTSHALLYGTEESINVVQGTVMANALLSRDKPLLGYCWDLEHSYAAGDLIMDENLDNLKKLIALNPKILIHLNTIEKGVKRGSGRDRHSETAIYECSVYNANYYFELVDILDQMNIPYIREVKADTMERELEFQRQYEAKYPSK